MPAPATKQSLTKKRRIGLWAVRATAAPTMSSLSHVNLRVRSRQHGQALIYGLFMLSCGLVALFFVFNTGQLTLEKTRLVNTADAVAYSAGVLHARALNFDAYTNRALMANEVTVAQAVSLASWIEYAKGHTKGVKPLLCYQMYSVPVVLSLLEYSPLCYALSYPPGAMAVEYADEAIQPVAEATVRVTEAARLNLQLAQDLMFASLPLARASLMKEVADANYLNAGPVKVDTLPLTDEWLLFEGAPFLKRHSGDERARFREAAIGAANRDAFIAARQWDSDSPWACLLMPRGNANRTGGTSLQDYDDWRAQDRANLRTESWHIGLFSAGCKTDTNYQLGSGSQSAADWGYSGIRDFHELSAKALAYGPGNADAAKRDLRMRFAIRLTRAAAVQRTSSGAASVKPAGAMAIYDGAQVGATMAAVGTAEVYFERPLRAPRADGRTELASAFNPYWQVRLGANSAADLAKAIALQTGSGQ